MIIIAGYSLTEAADRDAAVAAFQPMLERTRREGGWYRPACQRRPARCGTDVSFRLLDVAAGGGNDREQSFGPIRQVTPVPAFNEYIKYHGKFHLK
jgi:hypothetical protein